ncbi:uncharacterized protein LOC129411292 [Boleophthalmus pectinirostris]|uniref:uncharacterized protein LOC129411292 n=1 Tax=Boleophthalmus pectinirostris TaxID=150288 RepID=UPI00242C1A5B|nr:uncharacterized protein LOC129411292 [Boleophthalmus pectinirostris]
MTLNLSQILFSANRSQPKGPGVIINNYYTTKDREMSSKAENSRIMQTLRANVAAFMDLLDKDFYRMKRNVDNCHLMSNKIKNVHYALGGFIFGVAVCALTVFSFDAYVQKLILSSLVFILFVAIVFIYKSCLDGVNLNILEFRKSVYSYGIELGKLKQRCEDIKGTLGYGIEKDIVERIEETIKYLLEDLLALPDQATLQTMNQVHQEYMEVLKSLEKIDIFLSFYRETNI